MKKIVVIGGTFDHEGGRKSSIVEKVSTYIGKMWAKSYHTSYINGGYYSELSKNVDFSDTDVLIWMPNISNDEDKILPDIKKKNPKLFLISSKRVVEKEYKESDIIGRLLAAKSNLGIMITKPSDIYNFKVLDPLGNCYVDSSSIEKLCDSIMYRVEEVTAMTRVRSVSIGEERDFTIDPAFIEFVKHSANEFTKHVNAVNPNRLLGNASTRCMYGFPAERQSNRIFVSQRNIDKKLIETKGFVEINPDVEDRVEYYGDRKPSVDTPIQLRLFNFYPNINYMVHGHVYINGAPMTDLKVPCGFLEEFEEVVALYPSPDEEVVVVNLRGHGCLIMTNTVEQLWNYSEKYVSRDFPEY